MQQGLFFAEGLNSLVSLYPTSPLSKKREEVKKLLLHSKKFAARTRKPQRKLKFSSADSKNGNTESDQRLISPSTLALPMASSRCSGKGCDTFPGILTRTGRLQLPSQWFYSNHNAIGFVLFRALVFSLYTLKVPASTCREKKSSFIVTQYLTGLTAFCNSVRGIWQAPCQCPHRGSSVMSVLVHPPQFLAMLVILFLVIAYISSRKLFLMCCIPAC